MSYPIDAFVRVLSDTVPKGTLMYVRGFWVLSAEIEVPAGVKRKSLILTGERAGRYFDQLERATGLAPAPNVNVELRADPTTSVADGTYPTPGAAVVGPDGLPQIWFCHPNSEHERRGFLLTGDQLDGEEHEHRPFIYFRAYEVWLKRDGKLLSDKPLFTVGA